MYRREIPNSLYTNNINARDSTTFLSDISPCYPIQPSMMKNKYVTKMYVFNSKYRKKTQPKNDDTTCGYHASDMVHDKNNTQFLFNNKLDNYTHMITGSTSNFELDLCSPIRNVVSMVFKSIEFYNCLYTIHEKNNFFYILCENVLCKIVCPVGNVTNDNIIKFIQCLNTQISCKVEPITFEISTSTCNTDATCIFTNKTKITVSNQSTQLKILFSDIDVCCDKINEANCCLDGCEMYDFIKNNTRYQYKTLGYILGFRKVEYILNEKCCDPSGNNCVTENQYCIESESVIELQTTRNIFLEVIDNADKSAHIDNIEVMTEQGSFRTNNILVKIPLFSEKNTIQYDTESDSIYRVRQYTKPVDISSLKIRILDDYGDIVNNQNSDFTFSIEFTTDLNGHS